MNEDLTNNFLKEKNSIIYVYRDYALKKIEIKDIYKIIKNETISINFKNWTIKIKKEYIKNFKKIENPDETYDLIDNWFYYNTVSCVKNYLYYENFSIVNFDNPFDEKELSKYKILNILIENIDERCIYTFNLRDLQMVILLIEDKTWAVKNQFKNRLKKIVYNNTILDHEKLNYLNIFEEIALSSCQEIKIEIEFEKKNHKFMVSYPEFKNGIGYEIVEYL